MSEFRKGDMVLVKLGEAMPTTPPNISRTGEVVGFGEDGEVKVLHEVSGGDRNSVTLTWVPNQLAHPDETFNVVVFNTGRKYTPQGQRIAYTIIEHGGKRLCLFVDADRGVDGQFETQSNELPEFAVQFRYDHNKYSPIDVGDDRLWRIKVGLSIIAKEEG